MSMDTNLAILSLRLDVGKKKILIVNQQSDVTHSHHIQQYTFLNGKTRDYYSQPEKEIKSKLALLQKVRPSQQIPNKPMTKLAGLPSNRL